MVDDADTSNWHRYIMVPPLALIHGPDGYSYTDTAAGASLRYGPFADPESAARDLAARFGQEYRNIRFRVLPADMPAMAAFAPIATPELRAFAAAVNAAMAEISND